MKLSLLTASSLLLINSAIATTLDNVVIQADKSGIPIHLSTLNVEIIAITNETITLEDALQQSPSIDIQNIHGQDGTTITLNGMDAKHVLITLDGMALNPNGQTINLNDINLANIESIEIIKGNASSQYGSQSMGGVINLVSKPIDKNGQLNVSVHFSKNPQQQSPLGNTTVKFNYSQVLDNLKLSHNFQVNSYSPTQLDEHSSTAEHSGGFRLLLNEKFIWSDLTGIAQFNLKRLTRPFEYEIANNVVDKNKIENEDRSFIQLNYHPEYFQSSAKYQFFKTQSIQDVIITEDTDDFNREITSHYFQANIQKNFDFANYTLNTGLSSHYESLSQIKFEDKNGEVIQTNELNDTQNKSSIEAFILHDWFVSDVVNVQSGLRTQYDSDFGFFHSPNIALRWDISSQHVLKASTGIGYRVPDLKERFFLFDHSIYGYEIIGNTNLLPETSFSNQIQWGFSGIDFSIKNAVYAHFLDNLIEQELDNSINNGIESYTNINNGEASIIGLDSSVNWSGFSKLDLSLGLNLLRAKYLNDNTDIINRPNTNIKSTAKWFYSAKTTFSTQLSWQSDAINSEFKDKPSVFLVNVNYKQSFTNNYSLTFTINNLTNQVKDPEFLGDSRPDTGLTFALNLSFNP